MSVATDNLRGNQKQLGADGCMVAVSRQALDEALAEIERLRADKPILFSCPDCTNDIEHDWKFCAWCGSIAQEDI